MATKKKPAPLSDSQAYAYVARMTANVMEGGEERLDAWFKKHKTVPVQKANGEMVQLTGRDAQKLRKALKKQVKRFKNWAKDMEWLAKVDARREKN
jgi:hypothetical protein